MTKCPNCKKEITELNFERQATEYYTFSVEKGQVDYDEVDRQGDSDGVFFCPECEAVITSDEIEAIRFLEKDDLEKDTKTMRKNNTAKLWKAIFEKMRKLEKLKKVR
jgi:hypothetical protein